MQRVPTEGVLSEAWTLYRRHWQHLASIALLVYVVVGFLSLLLTQTLAAVGLFIASIINLVGVFWLQGAMVKAVEDVADGRVDLSISDTFRAVRPYIGRIAIASVLAAIGIAIGFVLLLIPGFILMTIWAVLVPVIVLEDRAALESFGRSRELVRGWGTSVFGLIVLTFLILILVGIVLAIILAPLPQTAGQFIADLVSGAVTGPFVALTWTLLYYRLRDSRQASEPPTWPDGGSPDSWR